MKSKAEHWNAIFSDTEDSELGWYEKDPSQTLQLLEKIPHWNESVIFLPGAGTSILIDELIDKGPRLILNDISNQALNKVKAKLKDQGDNVIWLCQDISQPIAAKIPDIDIWIDRAVLHFLTEKKDINGYFDNIRNKLNIGGYAIFAEFSTSGAEKCAGLTLHRYSVDELGENLGRSFKLLSSFDHVFINPRGEERPYIYALFKRMD